MAVGTTLHITCLPSIIASATCLVLLPVLFMPIAYGVNDAYYNVIFIVASRYKEEKNMNKAIPSE